jgi:hypothetical protein
VWRVFCEANPAQHKPVKTENKAERLTTLTLQADILIPEGAQPVLSVDGEIVAFKLPSGSTIRPMLALEQETPKGTYKSLHTDKLRQKHGFEIVEYAEISFTEPREAKQEISGRPPPPPLPRS